VAGVIAVTNGEKQYTLFIVPPHIRLKDLWFEALPG
jgi:hypothetical protein